MKTRTQIVVWAVLAVAAGACTSAQGQTVGAESPNPPATATSTSLPATTAAPSTTAPPSTMAPSPTIVPPSTVPATTVPPTTTTPPRPTGTGPASTVGEPWGRVDGLLMFRGNPTRTWYGSGPVPTDPGVLWRFPDAAMCGNSPVGGEDREWCGSGWTGQPVVWNRPDGTTEVIFGAYDKQIHFLDAATGERTRPDFFMGDIIKGSVSLDPDGFPLLYAGSRDPNYRIIALDRDVPTELWSLPATAVNGMWNDDWDSNAVVIDDLLLVGGENSYWFAVHLNRGVDGDGLVTVDPQVVAAIPAFTDELVGLVGRQQSVENSTAVFGTVAYFANSAGRVVGVDISALPEGEASVVFDYWVGDDVDATLVIDGDGMLYASAQEDLGTARAAELGQLIKLDPTTPDDPVVWSIEIPARAELAGGIWATPALHDDLLYVATNPGELLAVDTATGEILWRDDIGGYAWSSPLIVDDALVVAVDCDVNPAMRAYDLADPASPIARWEITFAGGCLESTPAMWEGRIYVGSRDGFFYALGDGAP